MRRVFSIRFGTSLGRFDKFLSRSYRQDSAEMSTEIGYLVRLAVKVWDEMLRPPLADGCFDIPNWNIKKSASYGVSWNMKPSGKRARFRFTARLSALDVALRFIL